MNNNNNNNNNQQKDILEFIQACNLLNNSNNDCRQRGEKYLIEIKQRATPYEFCLKILEISNEPHVQFHALRTICDAFLNEWYNLPINYVEKLREKLLLFPVNYDKSKGKLSGYVLNQIAKCVSIMYKRKWKIPNEDDYYLRNNNNNNNNNNDNNNKWNKENICNKILIHIEKLLSSNDPSITVIGLTFINELIEEFSVNHASSALGLTWDFHIKCHRGFEQYCLQSLFINICKLFKKIMNDMVIINNNNNEYQINEKSKILNALKIQQEASNIIAQSVFEMINMTAVVIEKCLSFNFHEKTSDDKLLLAFSRHVLNNSYHQQLLRPGPAWKNCLINSNLLTLLNIFHNILYTKCNKNKQFNSTIRILRESIINMHSLSGHIFDTPININNNHHIDDNKDSDDDDDDELNGNGNGNGNKRRITFKLSPSPPKRRLKGMELVLNRLPYLKNCIINFNKYMWSLINNNQIDDELVMDICRMFQILCSNFRYELLVSITEFGKNEYYFFQGIHDLGNLLIINIPSEINDISTWSNEGFDILIQSIVSIISCYEIRKHNLKKQSQTILEIFNNMTQDIFIKFVEKMLLNSEIEIKTNPSGESSSQFNDAQYINERLLGMAMIGRINGNNCLPYLASKIQLIVSEIKKFKINLSQYWSSTSNNGHEIPPQQLINLTIMHEKLYWLFQFLGYTLADDPSREQAKIPNILITNNNDKSDILVKSIYPMFEWIQFENDCILNREYICLISPLLSQIVIKMLSRWANSYLMPNVAYYEHISLGLLKSFGSEGDNASKTLDMIIYKCYINIFKWREERDVLNETCLMLESFVKHSSIRPCLFKSQSYNNYILNKYYNLTLDLDLLPNELISIFIRIILQSVIGSGQENVNLRLQQFNKIALPIYNQFIKNCQPFANQNQQFFSTSEQFDKLELSIFKINGISKCCTDFTFDFLLKKQIFNILIKIIPKFSTYIGDNNVVLIIFKIFANIAETSLIDLDKNQSKIFLKLCVNLIEQFENHNLQRIKQLKHEFIDNKTKEKYEEMQIEEITVILKLLEFMSTKDLIDINLNTSNETNLICGQCIFKSFYYLTPNITNELLKYQSLCQRFYEVLSICIRGFTSTFATKLNNQQRNQILGNKILESLSSGQYEIIEYGLEIIQCFAEYHLEFNINSPFLIYLQQSIHKLFMLLIDIKTPKLIYPKLAETLLPVLISIGKEKIFEYLSNFINNVCKNGQEQQQKLANKFTILINKIEEITNNKNNNLNNNRPFPLDMKTKAEFREYFIKLSHSIRSVVTIH